MKAKIANLKKLSELNGIPGNEKQVTKYIASEIKPFVDELSYDRLGSIVSKKGSIGPKIMIAGHLDEVGLMVTQITKEGFIKFQPIGGWFSQVMLAQRWIITTSNGKRIQAVTGVKPPHLITLPERSKAIEIDTMYLDIGVSNLEEAVSLGIKAGDMITPSSEFTEMANSNYLLGKAWDNRIGSAVVMDVLKELDKTTNQVFGVFTVQEEVGLRGAKTTSYMVEPDIVFAIDTGVGNDVPGGNPSEQTLGKGPQILFYDGGLIAHRALRTFVIEIAKKENIPFQEAYIQRGRTDAGEMHLAHRGAASLSICIPTRYMHSHNSIIHKEDYLNTVKLLKKVIVELTPDKVQEILYHD